MATYNGIVLGGALKFRKTPSTSGTVMTSFPTGTKLSVSTVIGNDSWYKTTVSSYGTGYVMKAYVAVKDDTVKVTGNDVNVRASASISGTRLYTLDEGATATVQDVDSDWVKIKPSGKNAGWINAKYVNKTASGSSSGGDDGGTVVPGVNGNGPNSTISAADIRNNGKSWCRDLKTKHPQIAVMQTKLNSFIRNQEFEDINYLEADGVYGDNTVTVVKIFQKYMTNPTLAIDGVVGKYTLAHIENRYGTIS